MAKSKPIGVRFDLYKLEMIQKEQNLTSVQQVVNYLMDNYGKSASNLEDVQKSVQIPVKSEKKPILEPPSNLTGIDLIIWKAENKNN
jgi:chromosome segregation and condensation protein ScpB